MKLEDGWNQIVIHLADFTNKAFGTNYVEISKYEFSKPGSK
jgi:hypothetical protein